MIQHTTETLAAPWRRILAFFLDIIFIVCFVRFALFPIFIAKNWDIVFHFQKSIVIPAVVAALLLLLKDSLFGVSVGKFFCSIGIKKVKKNTPIPTFLELFIRNIPLFLLPVELFLLVFHRYSRRWGDYLVGSFVLNSSNEIKKNPIRWLSKRVIFLFLLLCLIISGYFLSAPLQVKKSYAYEITKKKLENDEKLLQNFGKIVKYSYWMEFYYDKEGALHLQYKFSGQYFDGKANFVLDFDKKKFYTIKKLEILKIN
jgi:uncharacterized RDD family membrane protein YckC